jgi:hypothetical protein
MKTILSVFDHSGNWPEYFSQRGDDVITWDIKDGRDVHHFDSAETTLDTLENVDGILAAVPCTEFTKSGAQYWWKKDQDGTTTASMELVYQVLKLVDLFMPTDPDWEGTFFWAIENPVGRLGKLFPQLPKPLYFDPCDYAGYLELSAADHQELDRIRKKQGKSVTAEEAAYVVKCNAYTKRTGLWGDFNHNMPNKRVEPVKLCSQGSFTQRLGGSSERTKELRSITPLGFAKAFFEANKNYRPKTNDSYQLSFSF